MPFKFPGGIHPHDKKSSTNSRPIMQAPAPEQVAIPMSQHIGAPCSPTVAVGDTVSMGQIIGNATAPVSAPVHASVSGKVIKIEPRVQANGAMVSSVVIENDGLDTPDDSIRPRSAEEADGLTAPELAAIIRSAGIVGKGGATFPTAFKITSGKGRVKTLIINGAECEPYITSDHRTMLEYPQELLGGILLLMRACEVSKAFIGIETNKPDAIALLKEKIPGDSGIEIFPLVCRYPQGAEKQLIQTLTGEEVPPGGLPADVGCVMFNVFTAYSVYRAVRENRPSFERVVTVSGSAVKEPKNLLTRVGTPLSWLFENAGGLKSGGEKIIVGGPMMGNAVSDLSVPVTKGTNAVLAFTAAEDKSAENPVCIRCGRCADVCPMRLMPMFLYMYERASELENLKKYRLTDCIECGSCAYVCPGRLHLTQSFRVGKVKLTAGGAR